MNDSRFGQSPSSAATTRPAPPNAPKLTTPMTRPMPPQVKPPNSAAPHAAEPPPQHKTEMDLSPIDLVDEALSEDADGSGQKIRAFGVAQAMAHKDTFNRATVSTGHGACRVRSFHGRLSDEGLAFMDDKINDWLDRHPEIDVKNVTTTVGLFEGKIKEPALIVNVWF